MGVVTERGGPSTGSGRGAQARVLDGLREAIVSGARQPGQPLSELALATEYDVSRTPVREALKQLQIEGLVEIRPRVGTFVRVPSRRELVELFELKEMLEGMAARLLAARGDTPVLDRLEDNLERSGAAVDAGDAGTYADLVHEFHELVVTGADNTRLTAHYRTLMNQLAYHRLVSASLTRPGRLGASLSEHQRVLDLVREKDGFGAEFAMRDHVRSSERATMSLDDPLRTAPPTDGD
ncbi:Transcriptional regulator, GntR family [Pseudonocardia sp. Ae168_Ps1]|uniref:GntR family transcriptional regulator n=1 Tax=unclassified Pseudonocardia TaxID=2619320 RepID=UPI00094B662D|nr:MULTISPECIES: GntR family transcriptional regulator [unclassified Pseudonocardia]OLL72349.1 Transcriptional regulator, GntR family [Pseudonocardia sp. Ae150A_Ps1]OLL78321.1 Transcriptional regulator, GntR family [Pseudonocardia sp. Ae168_Ps1]OLL87553.1 Transcriptional regulator, GntR family [Pseudonocardia sp. Ae263_Ps1]OLL92417.1 Transcriptional regulator, GntR family [Pseudonocardia sp. Ae356_Ps1]